MLILETGDGLPDSNSYGSVAGADSHFDDRGDARWAAATSDEKRAALIRATDYIDANYVFKSVRLTATQALENPRYVIFEELAGIPPALVKATYELALIALDTKLDPVITSRDVIINEVTAGPITKKTTFDAARRVTDNYPAITKLLKPLATRRGATASSALMREHW